MSPRPIMSAFFLLKAVRLLGRPALACVFCFFAAGAGGPGVSGTEAAEFTGSGGADVALNQRAILWLICHAHARPSSAKGSLRARQAGSESGMQAGRQAHAARTTAQFELGFRRGVPLSQRPRSFASQSSFWASLPGLICSVFIKTPHLRRSSSLRGSARAGAATFGVTTLASAAAVAVSAAALAAAAARLGRRGPGVLSIPDAAGVRVAAPRSAPAASARCAAALCWLAGITLRSIHFQDNSFAFCTAHQKSMMVGGASLR